MHGANMKIPYTDFFSMETVCSLCGTN